MHSDFEGLDDTELVRLARDVGRPEYTEELIRRYMPLIRARAARFENMSVSRDDLVSEGCLTAVRAVKRFDETKSDSFGSYLSVCITNRLISVLRNAEKNPVADETSAADAKDNVTPETIFLDRELYSEIRKNLSELEYKVFGLYIEGRSYGAIADMLGISLKSADNAMQRVRKKLRGLYDN